MYMKTIEDTSLLTIRIGDKLQYKSDGRIGQLVNIELAPNGQQDHTVVCILEVEFKDSSVKATSHHFIVVEEELYLERIYRKHT